MVRASVDEWHVDRHTIRCRRGAGGAVGGAASRENMRQHMTWTLCATVIAMHLAAAESVSAQTDLSGQWVPRYHEDLPERIPGPCLVNTTGSRSTTPPGGAPKAGARRSCGPRASMRAASGRLRHPWAVAHADLEGNRSPDTGARRVSRAHQRLGHRAHDLDGRPGAPAALCRAHLAGVLDGRVERQRADRLRRRT